MFPHFLYTSFFPTTLDTLLSSHSIIITLKSKHNSA